MPVDRTALGDATRRKPPPRRVAPLSAGPRAAVQAPPPPPRTPDAGVQRLRRALVAPPKENLRKYGFLTASMVENAKTKAVPPVPVRRGPQLSPLDRGILARPPISNKPYYPTQPPFAHSATGQAIFRDPGEKAPSLETQTLRNIALATHDVFGHAANPRVAALESVLGGVTGIPSLVKAVRSKNAPSAIAQAALFTPVGKIGELLPAGEGLVKAVRAARSAGYVKGGGRDAFGLAIRSAAQSKAEAKLAVDQADAFVHAQIKGLPREERSIRAQELFDEMRAGIRSRPISKFERVVTPKEAATHLRSVMNPENVQPPKSVQFPSMHPAAAQHQVIGDLTPEEWWARTQHSVGYDSAVGLKLADWYSEIAPMIQHFFGPDADAILRGFAVSQANASPAGGLTNVLRVRDKILAGESISKGEISTVSKSIEQAYKGQPVTSGMQAKLHDFSDALEGKTTRTWTGSDIRGGAPTPTDIHALRDLGYIDPKILRTLRERHGAPVAHLQLQVMEKELARLKVTKTLTAAERKTEVAVQKAKIASFKEANAAAIKEGKASGLALDSTGVAGTRQYNHAVAKYQAITDHLNEIQAWGKSDWTPAEVQALGWSAIQRFHGTVPEDAMFMIDRNTTSIAFEVLNGKTGIGDGLAPAAQYSVTKEVADWLVPRVLVDEGVIPRGELSYGLGGWENAVSPAAYIQVLASPEKVDRVVARLANLLHQYDVWGVRTGVTISKRKGAGVGKAALEIAHADFGNPKTVEAYWQALRAQVPEKLQQHFRGFSSFMREDPITGERTPGIRIITDTPPVSKAKSGPWGDQFESFVTGAAHDVGVTSGEFHYNTTNVEVRDAVQAQARTRGAPRVSERGRVGDPLAAEAQSRLADAVTRYSGSAEKLRQASRELHARGGLTFHDPHGLALGIPVEPPPPRALASVEDPGQLLGVSPTGRGTAAALRTPGEQVGASLHGASSLYGKQEELRRQERILRMQRGEAEMQLAGGGIAGYYAKLAELKGKLPALNFGAFKEFDQAGVEGLINHIEQHPDLMFWEKIRAQRALLTALDGRIPAPHEIKLLKRIFGPEVTENIRKAVPITKQARIAGLLGELWNLPRAFQSTMDFSAAFRQGLVAWTTHPKLTFQAFKKMFRMAGSQRAYEQTMETVVTHPDFEEAQLAGVQFSDMDGPLAQREEAWFTNMGEKIPTKAGGGIIRGSQRAYVGFLNKARMDIFSHLWTYAKESGALQEQIDKGLAKGKSEQQVIDETLKGLGDVVNQMTGRGKVYKQAAPAMNFLNQFLFSPRLMASRFNMISPVYYMSLPPIARRQALLNLGKTVGVLGTILSAASLAGAKVGREPRSADFGKIRFGNTRIDLLGGHAQMAVLIARLISGQSVSSTTGKTIGLTSGGYGKQTRLSILGRFARSKASPSASLIMDAFAGSDVVGQPFNWKKRVMQLYLPLLLNDAYNAYHQTGSIPETAGLYGLGVFGIGTQSYGAKSAPPPGGWSIPSGGGGGGGWKIP